MSQEKTAAHSAGVAVAIAVAFGFAILVFVSRLLGGDFPFRYEIGGAVAIGAVFAAAPMLALGARKGLTALFLPAAVIAVLSSSILFLLGVLSVAVGVVWLWAFNRSPKPSGILRISAVFVVATGLWLGAASTLFIHLDPVCVEWLADGTVRSSDVSGEFTGWVWDAPATQSGTSSTMSGDVIGVSCTSDAVTPVEAGLSLILAAGSVVLPRRILNSPS